MELMRKPVCRNTLTYVGFLTEVCQAMSMGIK